MISLLQTKKCTKSLSTKIDVINYFALGGVLIYPSKKQLKKRFPLGKRAKKDVRMVYLYRTKFVRKKFKQAFTL